MFSLPELAPVPPLLGPPLAIAVTARLDELQVLIGDRFQLDVEVARSHAPRRAHVIVVVAGMDGALPSVVGGLIAVPIIAVPTSVGYGAALAGFTALLGMLSSCASGLTVVNIDNGFGAAMAVLRILNQQITLGTQT